MDNEETMVEENFDEVEMDDTSFDDFVEEDESEDEDFPDEEDLEIPDEDDDEDTDAEEEVEPEAQPQKSEPGWIKQRVNKAVEKAVRETEARMQAMFDQQMKPIRDKMMEDEAQELVRSRKVADIETARELVRLRNGQPAAQESRSEQPRNENGQFASKEQIINTAKTEARIDELRKQAAKIKDATGIDVIGEFANNPKIKQRVVNGELDFYDVAEIMKKSKKRPPSPARSSNGGSSVTPNAFMSMSDKEFDRMERQIDRGVRYTMK